MEVLSYLIDHSSTTYQKTEVTIKFECVVQTKSKKLEQHLMNTWPKLLTHQQFTHEDNIEHHKMINYIKNNLTQKDIDDIHELSYKRGWWNPFLFQNKQTKCELVNYRAKMWSNPNTPYLEVEGEIKLDFKKLLDFYIKQNWMEFKTDSGLVSEAPYIEIKRSIPFALTYNGSRRPFDIILEEVKRQSNTRNTPINKLLVKTTKLKNIHSYKKDIKWSMDRKKILVELKERLRLLKDKALAEPIKYGLIGLAAHEIGKSLRQPKTKEAKQAQKWLR